MQPLGVCLGVGRCQLPVLPVLMLKHGEDVAGRHAGPGVACKQILQRRCSRTAVFAQQRFADAPMGVKHAYYSVRSLFKVHHKLGTTCWIKRLRFETAQHSVHVVNDAPREQSIVGTPARNRLERLCIIKLRRSVSVHRLRLDLPARRAEGVTVVVVVWVWGFLRIDLCV